MAERVGFEPTERFPVHSISSAANSTTLAPLQALPISDCQLAIGRCGELTCFGKRPIGNRQSKIRNVHGGEGGIRTHGGRKPTPVFETGALIHYATSPQTPIRLEAGYCPLSRAVARL
jgi:hypothetical protein